MDNRIIGPFILGIIGLLATFFFFRHYGAFRLPWYASVPMYLSLALSIVETYALLPYDASLCLFGSTQSSVSGLKITFTVLYWVAFCTNWFIMPIFTSVLTYKFALTWGRRILAAVTYNVKFWLWALFFISIGLIIMFATNRLTLSGILPLAIALSNAYGLLLMCLLLGYGFVAFPRYIWNAINPAYRLSVCLHSLNSEVSNVAQSIVDGRTVMSACETAMEYFRRVGHRQEFIENLEPRISLLREYVNAPTITDPHYLRPKEAAKVYKEMIHVNWADMYRPRFERFLRDVDNVIKALKETNSFLEDTERKAENDLADVIQNSYKPNKYTLKKVAARSLSIICGAMSLICFWGEIALMINPKLSLFNYISHLSIVPLVNELFITGVILSYMFIVSGWSLIRVRLGKLYRFVVNASSDDTIYFWVAIFNKVVPTVGYHFLLQIGGQASQTFKVLGVMDQVAFLGDSWNIFSPILMLIIALLVIFNVWDKILDIIGLSKFTFHESGPMDPDLESGKEILCNLRPSMKDQFELARPILLGTKANLDIDNPLL